MEISGGEYLLSILTLRMSDSINKIDKLQNEGYHEIFELVDSKLMSLQTGHRFLSRDFDVDHLFKIDDIGTCYALTHRTEGAKGIFVIYYTT